MDDRPPREREADRTELGSAPVPPLGGADHRRGDPAAPLVILYGDFTCPRCAAAHQRLRHAALLVVYRHFALRVKHPRALPLACAAEAAGLQGRFWDLSDALFADPGRIDDPHLWAYAEQLGLDIERFERDRRSDAVAQTVRGQVHGAIRAGLTVTPTLVSSEGLHAGPPEPALLARLAGARPGAGPVP